MRKRRILALVATFSVLMTSFVCPVAEAAERTDKAEVIFNKNMTSFGFSSVKICEDTTPAIVKRNGESCWLLDNSKKDSNLNMILEPSFKGNKFNGSEYVVEVDYYDHGKGYLRLFYDSGNYGKTDAGTIYMKNSLQWKTATFILQDAAFEGSVDDKYDLQLSIYARSTRSKTSSESVAVRRVSVKKSEGKNKIYPSAISDETGNAYEWYKESKILHTKLENFSGSVVTADVTYRLIGNDYAMPFEKTETLTFEADEIKNIDVDFGEVKRCGLYWYEVEVNSHEANIYSNVRLFEIAVLKTDPDGILNQDVYLNTHFSYYTSADKTDQGVSVLKKGNFAGIREGLYWASLYKTGVLSWEDYSNKAVIDALEKYGLKITPQLAYAPTSITGNAWAFPKGEKQLKEWQKYARYLAELLKDSVDYWEVWNEPEIQPFNVNNDPPEAYSDMFVAAAEVLHEVDPTAKVMGPSITNMKSDYTYEWTTRALAAGMGKVADALAIHAYSHTAPEEADMEKIVSKFKTLFASYGIEDPEILNTEIGFTTADAYVDSEVRKGYLNARSVIYFKSRDLTDVFQFYNFEKKGTILTDREDQFGVVSGAYDECAKYGKFFVPTESYIIMTAYNYVLADAEADGLYDSDDGNVCISKFKSNKFNSDIVTLYTINEPAAVTLKLGTDKVICYDYMGNESEIYGKNGVFTFTADEKPLYIRGDVEQVKILEKNQLFECNKTNSTIAKNDVSEYLITRHTDGEYTVETELPSCAELVSATGFENGIARIKIKNKAKIGDEFDVKFKVCDSLGKTVQEFDFTLTSYAMIEPTIIAQLLSEDNLNSWRSVFTVKNLSAERAVKGTLEFTSPSDFAALGKMDLGVIPKNTTGELEVSLPDIIKKGKETVAYDITLSTGEKYSFNGGFETALAVYAEKKPKIDGVLEGGEWVMDSVMYADNANQIVQMYDWGGPSDISGRSGIMWDENNFYLFAEVTDDVFNQTNPAASSWAGDGMQFGICYNEGQFTAFGQKATAFHEIGLGLCPEGSTAYRTISQDNYHTLGLCKDADVVIVRDGTKTTYEFSMPWSSLLKEGEQPKEGEIIGYSFLFNDNDGYGRRGWIQCGGGIAPSKNTGLFMQLKLIKQRKEEKNEK